MAYKVLVMSPLHNLGATTSAMILAQSMTYVNNTVMLLSTSLRTPLHTYTGLQNIDDPTRAITQVVKLIQNGAISGQDILNYSHIVSKNLYYLNTSSRLLSDAERLQIIEHVINKVTTDIVVIDNSDDIDTKFSKLLIETCDVILLVLTTSDKSFKYYKGWINTPTLQEVSDKICVLTASFNEVVAAPRTIAKTLGISVAKFYKIHYNPWIPKMCFKGELQTILPLARHADPRVSNLKNDMEEIQEGITAGMMQQVLEVD